jgi:hypothetical protein
MMQPSSQDLVGACAAVLMAHDAVGPSRKASRPPWPSHNAAVLQLLVGLKVFELRTSCRSARVCVSIRVYMYLHT